MKDWNDVHLAGGSALKAGDNAKPYAKSPMGNVQSPIGESADELFELECLADVDPVSIEWLWPDYLAVGKLTLLGGDPDLGKSLICNDVAARLSRQMHWPLGPKPLRAGSTIFLCSEDATADTVRPRCEAAGADLGKLHVLKMRSAGGKRRTFSLQDDLETLGEAATRASAALICIDALTSYMGKIDSHRTTDVRAVLEPIADFAEVHRVSILAVTHPPKAAQGSALRAYTGSFAFVAAPRLAFFVTMEPDTGRRLLLPVKNNIGPKARGIGYRIGTAMVANYITAPRIVWSDEPVSATADQAIAAAHAAVKDGGSANEAKDFLRELLADGPVKAKEAEEAAKAHDISERALKRAKRDLGVEVKKEGFQGEWTWALKGKPS